MKVNGIEVELQNAHYGYTSRAVQHIEVNVKNKHLLLGWQSTLCLPSIDIEDAPMQLNGSHNVWKVRIEYMLGGVVLDYEIR